MSAKIPPSKLKAELFEKAEELGLYPLGITGPQPSVRFHLYLEWVRRGYGGEMHYLSRPDRIERRRDLEKILPGVKSVLCVGLPYWPENYSAEKSEPLSGAISCYAWGRDYHKILTKKLKNLGRWLVERAAGEVRWYVDTGPIMERDLAARAGLGFIGKNTLLINPKYGSGLFLGELLCTHELPPDEPPEMPSCGSCTRCLDACPTGALVEPYLLDARKCISYLTIEMKGEIPLELRPKMENWIYGCDICQQVCPWNKFAHSRKSIFPPPPKHLSQPNLLELSEFTEEEFDEQYRGTPVRRAKFSRFMRNVAVALGNSKSERALPALKKLAQSSDPLIASHAQWAIEANGE